MTLESLNKFNTFATDSMEALFNFFKPKTLEQKRIDCFQRMIENQKSVLAASMPVKEGEKPKGNVEALKEEYKSIFESCKETLQDPR